MEVLDLSLDGVDGFIDLLIDFDVIAPFNDIAFLLISAFY